MLLNYLKLSLRLMARNPFFTFINVMGLSIGFAVFFVLWNYCQNELNSDRQWKDWERIVRVGYFWKWTDDNINWSQSQFGVWAIPEIPRRIAADYGEVESLTRIFRQENFTHQHIPFHGKDIFLSRLTDRGDRISFKETALVYADPNLFDFFSIPLITGNKEKVLQEVNSIVLSQKMAKKYFGEQDPVNQTLLINNHIVLKVTGIYQDLPNNSHLQFDAVISNTGIENYINRDLISLGGSHAYLKLNPEVHPEEFALTLNAKTEAYFSDVIPPSQRDMTKQELYIQPLSEMPFVNFRWDYYKPKSEYFLKVLKWVGLFTLFIAWVNYVQLSTSFYLKRLQEIGVRKTSGARPSDFVLQFLTESLLINVLSLVSALTFIQLVNKPIDRWFEFYLLPYNVIPISGFLIAGMVFLTGVLISGLLPILIYRKPLPALLLKKSGRVTTRLSLTKSLVVMQFSFSVVLIIWMFTVNDQFNHVLKAGYGLKRNEVAVIDLPHIRTASFDADLSVVMEKLKTTSGINGAAFFSTITGDADNNMICIKRNEAANDACMDTNGGVDENFVPFFQLNILAGRNFRKDMPSDERAVILSRNAVARIGFESPEDAVGSKILVNTGTWTDNHFRYAEIIGVVEDYMGGKESFLVNQGMGEGHSGIVLTYKDKFVPSSTPRKIAVQINMAQFEETSRKIESIFREIFPGQLFRLFFLDDQIAQFYDGEKTARNQILLFTLIAIDIACLGLLGMISNRVVEKTKELGIRKVLGAELYQIAQILLNSTARQIVLASAIGIPVAHYLTEQYLQRFSERIDLQWWHYTLPVMVLVMIMLSTVATVIWKAAKSNPVDSLKYE